MKIKNSRLCLLFIFLFSTTTWSQTLSEDFDDAECGDNTCSCCAVNYIDNGICLKGWFPSHGSPNTTKSSDVVYLEASMNNLNISGQAVSMLHIGSESNASCFDQGEGLFTRFEFEKGKCYRINFNLSKRVNTGTFNVVAANGLVASPNNPPPCCSDIPSIEDSEVIQVIDFSDGTINTGIYNTWASIEIIFSPSANYSQFWIYPNIANGDAADQTVGIVIDDIIIGPDCIYELEFSDPNVGVPSGFHFVSHAIKIGNNGNAGTINSNPNAFTLCQAGDVIKINPNTYISANGSNKFLAQIQACKSSEDCSSGDFNKIDNAYSEEKPLETGSSVRVYPNPATDNIQVSLSQQEEDIQVTMYDFSGKIIKEFQRNNTSKFSLDISELNAGMYLLQIKTTTQNYTERIVKQ